MHVVQDWVKLKPTQNISVEFHVFPRSKCRDCYQFKSIRTKKLRDQSMLIYKDLDKQHISSISNYEQKPVSV